MQKRIIAITTITTFATLALANAQSATSTNQQMPDHEKGRDMHKMMGKKMHKMQVRVNIMKLILAGDYNAFQAQASTTPFAKLSTTTFANLSTQMNAEKTAHEAIKAILKAAGVKLPGFDMELRGGDR